MSSLEAKLDGETVIGAFATSNTSTRSNYVEAELFVEAAGTHTVALVAVMPFGALMNIDWFELTFVDPNGTSYFNIWILMLNQLTNATAVIVISWEK